MGTRPALVFGIGLGLCAGAYAADFTFKVPVELHALHPDITDVRVNCTVTRSPTFSTNPFVKIAQGVSSAYPVKNGECNDIITVEPTVFSGKNPADGKSYRCDLHLRAGGQWFLPKSNPAYPLDESKPTRTAIQGTF